MSLRMVLARGIFLTLVVSHSHIPLAFSMSWTFLPYMEVKESYTDNVYLRGDAEKSEDFITELKPGFEITGESSRHKLSAAYEARKVIYKNASFADQMRRTIRANLHSELVRRAVFLDAVVRQEPTVVDYAGPVPVRDINAGIKQTETTIAAISPYLQRTVPNFGRVELRYRYSESRYGHDRYEDSRSDKYKLLVDQQHSNRGVSGYFRTEAERIRYSRGGLQRTDTLGLGLRIAVNPNVAVIAEAGTENNDFDYVPQTISLDGSHWKAGLLWLPRADNSFALYAGERPFGKTYSGDFQYRSGRTQWRLNYGEDYTSTVKLASAAAYADATDVQPVTNLQGPVIRNGTLMFSTEPFLQRSLEFSGTQDRSAGQFKAEVALREHDYFTVGQDEDIAEATLSWQRPLADAKSLSLEYQRRRVGFQLSEAVDYWASAGIVLKAKWSKHVETAVDYRHLDNDSSVASREYSENSASVSVRLTPK